jgi:hypothetical protein
MENAQNVLAAAVDFRKDRMDFYKRQCEYFLKYAVGLQEVARDFMLRWAEESALKYAELKFN